MRSRFFSILLPALALILAGAAAGDTIKGTATNGTTSKPAAGDEVTLMSLAQGMSETAHTKTDSSGHFSLTYDDPGGPHLVRVTHQEVSYFKMAPPGTNSVEVEVFDSAKKLDAIKTTVDVVRMQSDGSGLQAVQLIAVANSSSPPRTLAGEPTYVFALPDGAEIDSAAARAPNGQPLNTMPSPVTGQKDQYSFNFPLRPGETQFQISYHVPYSGKAGKFKFSLLHDVQHFVAIVPLSMHFSGSGAEFAPTPISEEKDANVQVATDLHAGNQIELTLSGTGVLAGENARGEEGQPSQGTAEDATQGGGMNTRQGPGGGLGKPIDSPDPLSRYRWPLLGGLGVLLLAGAVYVATHRGPAPAFAGEGVEIASVDAIDAVPASTPPVAPRKESASTLLDAMKEELFQLEMERQQGLIGDTEYATAKAALDTTLKRALERKNQR